MKLSILTDEDLHRIEEATFEVLEKVGVQFRDCEQAIDVLREGGCNVTADRVRFPRELVRECIRRCPDRNEIDFYIPTFSMREPLTLAKGDSHFGLIGKWEKRNWR